MAPRLGSGAAALTLGLLLLAACLFALFVAPRAILWTLIGVALLLGGLAIARQAETSGERLAGFLLPIAGLVIAVASAGWLLGLYDLRFWVDRVVGNPIGFGLTALGVLGAAAFIREGAQLIVDREWRAGLFSLTVGIVGLLLLGGAVLGVLIRSVAAISMLVVGLAIVAVVITSALSILVRPSSIATVGGPKLPLDIAPDRPSGLHSSAHVAALSGERNADPLVTALRQPDGVVALDLAGRGLQSLPAEIGRLRNLRSLDLGEALGPNDSVVSNQLRTLPATIGGLRRLQTLNLSANDLDSLPSEIGWLERLTSLNLSFNRFSVLPDSVRALRALETLGLERNGLSVLPDWIGELGRLRTLNVGDNRIAAVPASIGDLTELRSLDLSHNRIGALPSTIRSIERLETLSLRANALVRLPDGFDGLRSLRSLYLGDNPLDLEQAFSLLSGLPALETLELGRVGADALPPTIGDFPALRTLVLRSNALEDVPPEIARLTTLETLDLANNRLRVLPDGVKALRLRRLETGGNPLSIGVS
ncbi:MAG: leucine-rich repeat domain-containing protein [Dehalococcoidia bacterium]